MSIACNAFGIILLVSRSFAVLLSVCIGVGGWGWPSSLSVWRIEKVAFALMKFACWDARVLSVVSKPSLTPRAREKENSAHFLDDFFPRLVEGGGLCPLSGMLCLCPIIWFGMWVGLILTLDGWGIPETGEGFGNIYGH